MWSLRCLVAALLAQLAVSSLRIQATHASQKAHERETHGGRHHAAIGSERHLAASHQRGTHRAATLSHRYKAASRRSYARRQRRHVEVTAHARPNVSSPHRVADSNEATVNQEPAAGGQRPSSVQSGVAHNGESRQIRLASHHRSTSNARRGLGSHRAALVASRAALGNSTSSAQHEQVALDEALSRLPAKVGVMYAELQSAVGETSADDVMDQLNAVFAHALGTKDDEGLLCADDQGGSRVDVQTAHMLLEQASSQVADKQERVQALQADVNRALADIEAVRSQYQAHSVQCEENRNSTRGELRFLQQDAPQIGNLVEGVTASCNDQGGTPPDIETCTLSDGSFVTTFAHSSLRDMIAPLSSKSQLLVSMHLDRAVQNLLPPVPSLLQLSSEASAVRLRGGQAGAGETLQHQQQQQRQQQRQQQQEILQLKDQSVRGKLAALEMQDLLESDELDEESCIAAPAVPCEALADILYNLESSVDDLSDEIKRHTQAQAEHCQESLAAYDDQVARLREFANDASVALSNAVAELREATAVQRDRSSSFKAISETAKRQHDECMGQLEQADSMMCGAKRVRAALAQDSGAPFLGDCEVTEWAREPCSASCGGGTQNLTRRVVTAPKENAMCPVLAMSRPCNTQPCPVDGEMGLWHEWSECSRECGGGTRSRTREIKRQPENGGRPVAETLQQEVCNSQPCDQDCVLADWTPWSNCSKVCLGGHRTRTRDVLQQPIGNGVCPTEASRERRDKKTCNEDACSMASPQCASKLDLVVVLDVSGSVGDEGATFSRAFVSSLASRLSLKDNDNEPFGRIGVVEFASTASLLQELTSDVGLVQSAAAGVTWQRTKTNTAEALAMARNHLAEQRRPGVLGAVLVVTDGMPLGTTVADEVITQLHQCGTRVAFVPVGQAFNRVALDRWASWPAEENLVGVASYSEIDDDIVTKVIANLCPELA